MLILSRRISESLIVGDRAVVIKVLGIKGNQVRIGVEADKGIQVDREEVFLRKQQEKNGDKPRATIVYSTGRSRESTGKYD